MNAPFRFTTCRAGSEAALKRDIASHFAGELTPAFMKPQFITWKVRSPGFSPPRMLSTFARVSGTSLGLCKTMAEVADHARKLPARPVRLHVFPRVTNEDGVEAAEWQRIDAVEAEITRELQQAGVQLETRLPYAQGVRFDHWRTAAGRLNLTALPQEPALLLCDINLAPPEVLPQVARIQEAVQARRLILTIKLNTPALEDRAHEFIDAIRDWAPALVFATQLAANRREICVCAG